MESNEYVSIDLEQTHLHIISEVFEYVKTKVNPDLILQTANGVTLAHKVIMEASSSLLKEIFAVPGNETLKKIFIPGVSHEDLSFVVNLVYNGKIQITKDQLKGVQKAALTLNINLTKITNYTIEESENNFLALLATRSLQTQERSGGGAANVSENSEQVDGQQSSVNEQENHGNFRQESMNSQQNLMNVLENSVNYQQYPANVREESTNFVRQPVISQRESENFQKESILRPKTVQDQLNLQQTSARSQDESPKSQQNLINSTKSNRISRGSNQDPKNLNQDSLNDSQNQSTSQGMEQNSDKNASYSHFAHENLAEKSDDREKSKENSTKLQQTREVSRKLLEVSRGTAEDLTGYREVSSGTPETSPAYEQESEESLEEAEKEESLGIIQTSPKSLQESPNGHQEIINNSRLSSLKSSSPHFLNPPNHTSTSKKSVFDHQFPQRLSVVVQRIPQNVINFQKSQDESTSHEEPLQETTDTEKEASSTAEDPLKISSLTSSEENIWSDIPTRNELRIPLEDLLPKRRTRKRKVQFLDDAGPSRTESLLNMSKKLPVTQRKIAKKQKRQKTLEPDEHHFSCQFCQKIYSKSFTFHVSECYENPNRKFKVCPVCSKEVKPSGYGSHMKCHPNSSKDHQKVAEIQ